jgi:hypothetical protein
MGMSKLPYPDKIPGIKNFKCIKALKKNSLDQKRKINLLKHLIKDLDQQSGNDQIRAKLHKKAGSALDHHTYQRGQQAWDQVGKLATPLGIIIPGAAISVTVLSETKKVHNLEKYVEKTSLLNLATREKMKSLGKALLISAALRLASPYLPSVETILGLGGIVLGTAIIVDAAQDLVVLGGISGG